MAKAKKKKKETPAMAQWRRTKDEHPDKVVFFRMGDFYEMFYDDAKLVADVLGLTLTSRSKGENPIPMAGVPHHQCDRYVKELIEAGHKVAICDQLEDPAQAKGVVKRGVTRVITPGTLLDENCLTTPANNFLAAVTADKHGAGLACVDVSTGEFFVSVLSLETLGDELERLAPAETLIPAGAMDPGGTLAEALAYRAVGVLTPREGYTFDADEAERILTDHFAVAGLGGFGLDGEAAATGAAGAVLAYLKETQQNDLRHIRRLRRVERGDHLVLDRTTQRNLELTHALMEGSRARTLLGVLDRTRTGPGGRLLKSWLLRPLADVNAIRARQDAVRELMDDSMLRAELRELLSGIADMERIMARVITARANARDLSALSHSIGMLPGLRTLGESLAAPLLADLAGQIDTLDDVGELIDAALVEEPPATLSDGRLIREGYHAELDDLRSVRTGGKEWIASFQQAEQARTGIPSLKIGFNKVFGYYIEVTHTHKDKVPDDYDRKQTLTNAERYITPALKEREQQVLGAEERIVALEYELFCELRNAVAAHVERVQAVAQALAQLDVLAALAEVGAVRRYILPAVHDGVETTIRDGRHPVLETMLADGDFVANDTVFDPDASLLQIITGPNMAGKSTYIRQVALLTILAQMGSPVPAAEARIGLVDRVFTRVGAADDLARGQSTFMVEMSETANILNNATERSLVILDEVGRGTSTFDGVSLAWAITEYLHERVRARTLFATHYHEIAELGAILDRATNCNVSVRDWGGDIIFLHKIQPGAADRSYGIQVARLAGVPGGVIDRAGEILHGLEAQAADRDWRYIADHDALRAAARDVQGDLFVEQAAQADALYADLAAIDVNRLTPVDALQRLQTFIERAQRAEP